MPLEQEVMTVVVSGRRPAHVVEHEVGVLVGLGLRRLEMRRCSVGQESEVLVDTRRVLALARPFGQGVEPEAPGQAVGWVSGPRMRSGRSVDDSARVWIGLREGGNPG